MIKKIFEVILFRSLPTVASIITITPAVSIIISRVFSDFQRKQFKKIARACTPVFIEAARQDSPGIRFNLDNNLDRRTRNKNTRLEPSRELWRRRIKIVCNFVSDRGARGALLQAIRISFPRA